MKLLTITIELESDSIFYDLPVLLRECGVFAATCQRDNNPGETKIMDSNGNTVGVCEVTQ